MKASKDCYLQEAGWGGRKQIHLQLVLRWLQHKVIYKLINLNAEQLHL